MASITKAFLAPALAVCLLNQLAGSVFAAGGGVVSPHRRAAILKAADEVLADRQARWQSLVKDLPDPFYRPDVPVQEVAPARKPETMLSSRRSDREVLEKVAPMIQPTGTMLIGGEHFLLLGGKRFRSGDQISVTFEGAVYRITITSIERNSYTLRLNNHEMQRYFK